MTPTASLFPKGEPEVYGEYRGEALGRPFRRFEVQVYGARRFGAGVLVPPDGLSDNRPLVLHHLHSAKASKKAFIFGGSETFSEHLTVKFMTFATGFLTRV